MKILYCLILTSLAITQTNFMLMRFVINERHQQIQQNRQLIRHIMMKKTTVRKTARRVKKDQTSVWQDKFLANEVPESEWRDNFRMSERSFYELKNYTCFWSFTCINFIYSQKSFTCRCELSWTTAYKITKDSEMEIKELVNKFQKYKAFCNVLEPLTAPILKQKNQTGIIVTILTGKRNTP